MDNTRKLWIGLAVLALPTLLISIDVSVLYVALPSLSSDLGANGDTCSDTGCVSSLRSAWMKPPVRKTSGRSKSTQVMS